jgi:hypothetical protein
MKKKIKDTFAGKLITNLAKGAIKEVPLVGGLIHNAVEDTIDNPKGHKSWQQIAGQVIALGVLGYLVTQGYLSTESLSFIKGIL